MKKTTILPVVFLAVFVLSSCTVQIADRPDYYADYDDKNASYGQNTYSNYYNSYYSSAAAVNIPTVMPTLVPTTIVVVNYITLKVIENTYYFMEDNKEVAVWKFREDGTSVKKGKIISGPVRRYYDGTNVVESEIVYMNGERQGLSKKFYPNGLLKEEISYTRGERTGSFKAYYPNGKLIEEGAFNNGQRQGSYKKYFENGELLERGVFENGKARVIFTRATPVPTATATPDAGPNHKSRGGYYENNRWHGNNMAVTAVVTVTPAATAAPVFNNANTNNNSNVNTNVNNIVINNNVQVVITVVVTATPEIASTPVPVVTQVWIPTLIPTQVPQVIVPQPTFTPAAEIQNDDNHGNKGKPRWVVERKATMDDAKDDKKNQSEDIKQQFRENTEKAAEPINDAAGNTVEVKKYHRPGFKSAEKESVLGVTDTAEDAIKKTGTVKNKIKRAGPGIK